MTMSALTFALLLGAAEPAEPPAAAASDIAAAFGNTIVSTYPDGRKAHLWLKADGTYSGLGRRKKPSSGVWVIKGSQVCLKQKSPFPAPFSYCTPQPASAERWTAKAVTGEPITVELAPGIVTP